MSGDTPAASQLIVSSEFDPRGWPLPDDAYLRVATPNLLAELLAPCRHGVPTLLLLDSALVAHFTPTTVGTIAYHNPLRVLAPVGLVVDDTYSPFVVHYLPSTNQDCIRALTLAMTQIRVIADGLEQANPEEIAYARFSEIGRLAAGMIHELNNPLAFSRNNLMLLGERLAAGSVRLQAKAWVAAGRPPEHIAELVKHLDQLPSHSEDIADLRRELAPLAAAEKAALLADFLAYFEAREQDCNGSIVDTLDSAEPLLRESIRGLERMGLVIAGVRTLNRPPQPGEIPVDIDRIIRESLAVLRDRARSRQVTIHVKQRLSQPYPCDSAAIAHIVLAIGARILEAAPVASEIRVATREQAGQIEISVDRPVGVSQGLDELLTGTVCHRLARQLGGALLLEDVEDARTRICLRIPLSRLQAVGMAGCYASDCAEPSA